MKYNIYSLIGDLKLEIGCGNYRYCQLFLDAIESRFKLFDIPFDRKDNKIIGSKIVIWFEPVDFYAVLEDLRSTQINPSSLKW